jgi:ABC-type Na+ efflux pump permease subunit
VGVFTAPHWGRLPLWALALVVAGLAFGALGVALGALAREVRAASLLAFGLALPVAFLALVPDSAVSGGVRDVLAAISAIFPFKPALQAIDAAVNASTDPGLGRPLVHLVVLAAAWGAVARLAVRRF